ncbi:MAG TPA: hypothetical protein ENK18_13795, partial [Deltaproteobacteria bacterium]|nr:hypothetical protein [Deltaproteobacteria bacterium]
TGPTGGTGPTGDTGPTGGTGPTGDTGLVVPFSFTAGVDGDLSDWPPEALFVTSSGTQTGLAWDATSIYVAVQHPDVALGGPDHWVLIYLGDGVGGTTTGVMHNTQEPTLPFGATHLVRWKADDSYNSLETYDGGTGQWVSTASWLGTVGSAVQESDLNEVVEFGLPRGALGLTDTVQIHVDLIYEGAGSESSYAVTPSDSFVEGYDPDYGRYWQFDLASPDAPNAAIPLP